MRGRFRWAMARPGWLCGANMLLIPGPSGRVVWVVLLLLLLVCVVPWIAAIYIAMSSQHFRSLAVGFANGERSVVTAIVFPTGHVVVRKIAPNLGRQSGFFIKPSEASRDYRVRFTLLPRFLRGGRRAQGRTVLFHLGPPSAVLSFTLVAWPLSLTMRRRYRRRSNRCEACGYDMTGATSQTCTECGTANNWFAAGS